MANERKEQEHRNKKQKYRKENHRANQKVLYGKNVQLGANHKRCDAMVNHYKKTAGRGAKNAKQDKGQQFNQDGFHSFHYTTNFAFWLDKNALAGGGENGGRGGKS